MMAEASSVVPTAHGMRSDWLEQEVIADRRGAADLDLRDAGRRRDRANA